MFLKKKRRISLEIIHYQYHMFLELLIYENIHSFEQEEEDKKIAGRISGQQ